MANNMFDLSGKVAVVSGSNDGIGQGITIGLAEAGADIVALHRSDISATKEQVEKMGRRIHTIQCDLSKTDEIGAIMDEAEAAFGRIDILANCAGMIARQPALQHSEENWDNVMTLNIKSVFFMCQAAANKMVAKGIKGKIINIASMMSYQGGILIPGYAASKGAIKSLTMELSNEWGELGINVNALAPGYIATKMTKALREDPKRSKELMDRIPLHRFGEPQDFKGPAVFLASSASDYINGITIPVDGGWLAR